MMKYPIISIALFMSSSMLLLADESTLEKLLIGIANVPPALLVIREPVNKSVIDIRGSLPTMYDWIAKRIKMTYVPILVNETEMEKKGVFTAALDQMLRDEVDIAGISYVATAERYQRMDFSFPFSMGEYRMLTPVPGEKSRIWAVIRPFQPMVWLFLGIALIVMVLTLSLFSKANIKNDLSRGRPDLKDLDGQDTKFANQLSQYFIFAVSSITNQGAGMPYSRNSFRILAGTWFLIALVLVNSYAGILITALTVPTMEPVIDTLEDMAARKQDGITLAVNVDSVLGRTILEAKNGLYRKLGDQLRDYPKGQFRTVAAQMECVASMRYAVLDVGSFSYYTIGTDFEKHNRTCRYRVSLPVPNSSFLTLALRKGGRHNKEISKGIMYLMETGMFPYWLKQDMKLRFSQCTKRIQQTAEKAPIKLTDLTSAFLTLGIGISLASINLALEFAHQNIKFGDVAYGL